MKNFAIKISDAEKIRLLNNKICEYDKNHRYDAIGDTAEQKNDNR